MGTFYYRLESCTKDLISGYSISVNVGRKLFLEQEQEPVIPGFLVSQPGFRDMSLGVPRETVIEKKHRFLNLLAKINRSTEKYYSLLKREFTIIIGLLYVQLTDHANVP
jgi:hypothetical protein